MKYRSNMKIVILNIYFVHHIHTGWIINAQQRIVYQAS